MSSGLLSTAIAPEMLDELRIEMLHRVTDAISLGNGELNSVPGNGRLPCERRANRESLSLQPVRRKSSFRGQGMQFLILERTIINDQARDSPSEEVPPFVIAIDSPDGECFSIRATIKKSFLVAEWICECQRIQVAVDEHA
nr:hypothetical protein [Rhodopirellula islandica]